MIGKFREMLFYSSVDIASLVAFRIAFGSTMLWEVLRYFHYGWIADSWIEPAFHFTYPGFGWVKPWPGTGMYIHMAVLGVLASCITLGLFYRASALLFCLGFAYTFLLEHSLYLNHLYFVCLVGFLMIFVPANRRVAMDVWMWPRLRTETVPFWSLWILRAQLAVVYFFGGIAKLNADWFRGEPLRSWLKRLVPTPYIGPLFGQPETFHLIAWGGLAFDLLIVPMLLWKRTRLVAFLAAVCFHLLNAWFFSIGIFPWFSIAMTTLFLDPSWPRKALEYVGLLKTPAVEVGACDTRLAQGASLPRAGKRLALLVLSGYMLIQLLVPLRHWLYPGDVAWTEEGHEFSWRMKLRGKEGYADFLVSDPLTAEAWFISPSKYLKPWQKRRMATRPELIRQFAHYLGEIEGQRVGHGVEVYARASARLIPGRTGTLVDPNVDLANEPYTIGAAKWIVRARY